jgi:hypothetical protein
MERDARLSAGFSKPILVALMARWYAALWLEYE